jgi:hypothetical protein
LLILNDGQDKWHHTQSLHCGIAVGTIPFFCKERDHVERFKEINFPHDSKSNFNSVVLLPLVSEGDGIRDKLVFSADGLELGAFRQSRASKNA